MGAAKADSPDHDYLQSVRARFGSSEPPCQWPAKLARRCHHTVRELGDDAWSNLA